MRETLDVPVDGASLRVTALGEPDAPRVVMLHGALAVGHVLLSQAVALKATHRVYLVDQRGHGGSTPFGVPGNGWDRLTTRTFVADGLALLDHFGPSAFVGHSLGGIVSAHVAASRPGDVHALGLLATAPRQSPERAAYFAGLTVDAFDAGQQGLWARWHGEPYWRTFVARGFAALAGRDDDAYAGAGLAAYRGPALVVGGEEDALVPAAELAAYEAWLPHAAVRFVPGDHAFHAGRGRAATNALLRDLLAP